MPPGPINSEAAGHHCEVWCVGKGTRYMALSGSSLYLLRIFCSLNSGLYFILCFFHDYLDPNHVRWVKAVKLCHFWMVHARFIYSSKIAATISPGMVIFALNPFKFPVFASRSIRTTRASDWSPTATRVPALLISKCRGTRPPDGKTCNKSSVPAWESIPKVMMESDAISVLFVGSKFGRVKVLSPRDETTTNRPSSYELSASCCF